MATRPQIERLSKRIESLAAVHQPMRIAVIYITSDETDEEAIERHYKERPEDRHALVGSDLKCDPAHGFVLQIRKGAPGRPLVKLEESRPRPPRPCGPRAPRPDRLNPTRPTARTRVEHLGQHGAGRYSDLEDPTHPRRARHVFMLSVYVHC